MEFFNIFSAKLVRKQWLVAPLLLLVSSLILLFIYCQSNWSGKWVNGAKALIWNGEELTLDKGHGYGERGGLVIDGLEKREIAVASLSPTELLAEDYPYVNWTIINAGPGTEVEFLWRTAGNRTFVRPLVWQSSSVASLQMDGDENWRGQVLNLALVVKGPLGVPITVKGVTLEPVSPQGMLLHMVKGWLALDPWQATSINFVGGNATEQNMPPVLAIAAIVLLALVLYLILVTIKILPLSIAVIWGIVFLGWFALDVRWQANLLRQVNLTQQQFAGKSWEGKHLAAEDGQLFDLMQQIKAKLNFTQSRIFLFTDDEYTQKRGTYYLLPLNVLGSRQLFSAGQFKPGDFIVILGKDEVVLDPARHLLKWGAHQLKVELVLLAANNVLVRVQ